MTMVASAERRRELEVDFDPIALTDRYSIQPYTVWVPNKIALGTSFMTEKAQYHLVSLPRLSIQRVVA